jgi:glycosyltransferase involved in cell wall biosynthesis
MRIVFISSLLPSGHFSEILCSALQKYTDLDITIYSDWRKGPWFMVDILKQLAKDRPNIVHIQQELNMYGGGVTILLFPILLLIIRLMKIRVITTIHAAVYKREIDERFISLFLMKKPWYIKPFILKVFFHILFISISRVSDSIVCHSNMMKDILTTDYGVQKEKVHMIRTIIPTRELLKIKKENYFLYFGYIVRRKGLEKLIDGFATFHTKYPDFKLVLAGGTIQGQEKAKDEIKSYVHHKQLDEHVAFTGFVDKNHIDTLYKRAYAVVMPAYLSMGSSGPLYHAQSYGKCIIASDIGHFKEDIQHNINGLLVDNDKWDTALTRVVNNTKLVDTIEHGVKQKAKEKSPQVIAKQYEKLYTN